MTNGNKRWPCWFSANTPFNPQTPPLSPPTKRENANSLFSNFLLPLPFPMGKKGVRSCKVVLIYPSREPTFASPIDGIGIVLRNKTSTGLAPPQSAVFSLNGRVVRKLRTSPFLRRGFRGLWQSCSINKRRCTLERFWTLFVNVTPSENQLYEWRRPRFIPTAGFSSSQRPGIGMKFF